MTQKLIPISICVIMKNEEKHMDSFLSAIKKNMGDYPYEIVLVDTGSTDSTLSIAQKYTDRIFHFQWIQDFSAARNYSLTCASNDWILVLDCDEYLQNIDTDTLQQFAVKSPRALGMISLHNHYNTNGTDSISTDEVERFFNRQYFHYENIIHEQLRTSDSSAPLRVRISVEAEHHGYAGTYEEMAKKVERNNLLLFQMLKENPSDPYLYFQIGQCYNMIQDTEKACYYYGKGLEFDVDPRAEYVRKMVVGYGYALLHLERYEEALQFQNIYDEFATTSDFVCLMGLIYLRAGYIYPAIEEFQKATTFQTTHTEGTNSYIPYFNMGCIHEVLGNTEEARSLYRKCGNFRPALERLHILNI